MKSVKKINSWMHSSPSPSNQVSMRTYNHNKKVYSGFAKLNY